MIKRFFQNSAKTMLVVLFTAALSVGFSACHSDDDDNPSTAIGKVPQEIPEPTEDQMLVKVTSNMPFFVKGQFDDKSMGAALIKRLGTPSPKINDDTRLMLMKGSDIKNLSNEELLDMAKIYCQGGYLAFEKPTAGDMLAFAIGIVAVLIKAENELLTADGDVTITPDSPEAASFVTSSEAEHLNSRIANMRAYTKRGAKEDDESSMQEVLGEMVILALDSYYLCECYEGQKGYYTISDKDGNTLLSKEEEIKKDYTYYQSGRMADGVAQWLNSRVSSMNERKAEACRLAVPRADGNKSINELMSASDEFTYQTCIYGRNETGEFMKKPNAHQETIRIWGVHNTKTNKDYYYVQQKSRLSIGGKQKGDNYPDDNTTLYKGPEENDTWWIGSYDVGGIHYKWFYGAWLHAYELKMDLTGSGSIKVEEAIPTTDNNNVSTAIAIGESHSETNTLGFTLGGAFGTSGASFNPSINYSHGWTDGTSFSMTTTSYAKELKCNKNTNGTEVTWTYECGKNMDTYKDNKNNHCHPSAPDVLINDVDFENQVCWSVSNPSGSYQLKHHVMPTMQSMIKKDGSLDWNNVYGMGTTENTYSLKTPNRVVQEWYMDITFPEIGQAGHHGDKGKLIEYLQRQFPDLYQPRLSLADQTDTSEGTIKYLVEYTKKLLLNSDGAQTMREYALDLGLSQYTVKWYTIDGKHNKYEFVVKAK